MSVRYVTEKRHSSGPDGSGDVKSLTRLQKFLDRLSGLMIYPSCGSHPGKWGGGGTVGVPRGGSKFFQPAIGDGLVCMCEAGHTNIQGPKDRATGTLTCRARTVRHAARSARTFLLGGPEGG
jgi:hypothetical protein